ncbi:helix-turn-helix domain-containing protein [Acuticoccus sp. I52.16.1]|uniref:helix-turn-helix domain-containing protein n=1 Tax=Acuticoccus sp. I52.16.1 TaxID=2928472 RepID=UPI001FD2C7CF|nr:helix-turn-helix domain-containing protein [Acuticoccus sp. I52.16.1]UOM34866.1 helix-turn-helix domain-containing protein [Acuticoccus sp. I52.16.1]
MVRTMMEEPAWRALSTTAQALYPWLKLEWRGKDYNNNGKIRLSTRQAAERLGVTQQTARLAFHDLQAKGFVIVTEHARLGVEGVACSPAFELTELKMPASEKQDGRKLYRDWREGRDYPVHVTNANNPQGRNGRKRVGNVVKLKPKEKP